MASAELGAALQQVFSEHLSQLHRRPGGGCKRKHLSVSLSLVPEAGSARGWGSLADVFSPLPSLCSSPAASSADSDADTVSDCDSGSRGCSPPPSWGASFPPGKKHRGLGAAWARAGPELAALGLQRLHINTEEPGARPQALGHVPGAAHAGEEPLSPAASASSPAGSGLA